MSIRITKLLGPFSPRRSQSLTSQLQTPVTKKIAAGEERISIQQGHSQAIFDNAKPKKLSAVGQTSDFAIARILDGMEGLVAGEAR